MPPDRRTFPSVSHCDPSDRGSHAVAADLDGTLLVSRSSFPYFLLLAVEAGSLLRGLALLLLSPLILILYKLVSESAAIQLLIFVSVAGLRMRDVELAARAVLPRFYAADVRAESWAAFRACGRRRVVVTANPRVMVEGFVRDQLGGDMVLGTELEVNRRTGRATGFVAGPGVLVGTRKRAALVAEFGEGEPPELGLGDRESDHDFMALCKLSGKPRCPHIFVINIGVHRFFVLHPGDHLFLEGYMVPPNPSAARVPLHQLDNPVIFHDGRFVQRPDPLVAVLTFLWIPLASPLAVLRLVLTLAAPARLLRSAYSLSGVRLAVRGHPPPPPAPGSPGSLLVCNHRTALDPAAISAALGRPISVVPASALSRDRVAALLRVGDVVLFPEGTTCRGPYLLRFSEAFAGLSDRIVPVAVEAREAVFYGTTERGWKLMDRYFFFMNPRPGYEVAFLEPLRAEETCGGGGRLAVEVAEHVREVVGRALGFECTGLTGRDKYMELGGIDGKGE